MPDLDLTIAVPTGADPLPSPFAKVARTLGPNVELLPVPRERMVTEAAERARGVTILFLGADVVATEETLHEHLRVQRAAPAVGIGPTDDVPPLGKDLLARCSLDNLSVPRRALLELSSATCPIPGCEAIWIVRRLELEGLPLIDVPTARVTRSENARAATRRIAADAAAHVALVATEPELLPRLPLGAFAQVTLRELIVRRVALALRVPAVAAVAVTRRRASAGSAVRYCYWKAVRRAVDGRDAWRRLTCGSVILLYHAIAGPGERGGSYVVPARRFERQMRALRLLRYSVVTVGELLQHRNAHRLPPARSVVVTFDDGYADNRSVAAPILRKHGVPATVFVVTGAVGATNSWVGAGELRGRTLLSWDDLDALVKDGFEIGSHTASHRPLPSLSPTEAVAEAASSRRTIEQRLHVPVPSFAYPHGANDAAAQAVVEFAGYHGACTTTPGLNDPATPAYALRRADIRGNLSLVGFLFAVWAGGPGLRRRWREGR